MSTRQLKNITPEHMMCVVGSCPAIYETDRETIVIVGTRFSPEDADILLSGQVAPHEEVIEIPRELLKELTF